MVGIACSRLVEQFCRPVILMQQTGEDCHGSARSIEGFNLHEAIGEFGYYLIGLHAAAALYHHHFMKDNTLLRMLPARRRSL